MTPEFLVAIGALVVSVCNGVAIIITAIRTTKATGETKAAVLQQAATIKTLELNTNSIKDALVETTRNESLLRGRADLLAEQEAGKRP